MTRAELEALARRVETEEPSRELLEAIALALGWARRPVKTHTTQPWLMPDGSKSVLPSWLTSLDAAVTLLGRTWVATITDADDEWFVLLEHPLLPDVSAYAPTEPQARTAAALRAVAMEASDDQ